MGRNKFEDVEISKKRKNKKKFIDSAFKQEVAADNPILVFEESKGGDDESDIFANLQKDFGHELKNIETEKSYDGEVIKNKNEKKVEKSKIIDKKNKNEEVYNIKNSNYDSQRIYNNALVDINKIISNDKLGLEDKITKLNIEKNILEKNNDNSINIKQLLDYLSKKIDKLDSEKKSFDNIISHSEAVSAPLEKTEDISLEAEEKLRDEILNKLESTEEEGVKEEIGDQLITQEEIDFLLNSVDEDLEKDAEDIIELTEIVKPENNDDEDKISHSEQKINSQLKEGKILKIKVRRANDNIDDGWTIKSCKNGKVVVEKIINKKKKEKTLPLSEIESLNREIFKEQDDSYYADSEAAIIHVDESDNSKMDSNKDSNKKELSKEEDELDDFIPNENLIHGLGRNIYEEKEVEPGEFDNTEASFYFQNKKEYNGSLNIQTIKDEIVKDPVLKNEIGQTLGEIYNLPKKEKKSLVMGFLNFGYQVSEFKNKNMKNIVGFINDKLNHDNNKEVKNKFLDRFLRSSETKFFRQAKKAREMRELQDIRLKTATFSGLKTSGQLMVMGRIIHDLHEGKMPNGLNPFRHATAIASVFGGVAEVAKETRFKYEGALDNTRIDEDRAYEEAHAIYEKALEKKFGKNMTKMEYDAELEKTNNKSQITFEYLKNAYRDNLPKDIAERFSRNKNLCTGAIMSFFKKDSDVKKYSDMIIAKLDKIEKNKKFTQKQKKVERERLLMKYEDLLNDLDRMVGDAGQVDKVAYWARVTEKVSKGVALGLITDSIFRLGKAGFEYYNFSEKIKNLTSHEDIASETNDVLDPGTVSKPIPENTQPENILHNQTQTSPAEFDELEESVKTSPSDPDIAVIPATEVKPEVIAKVKIEGKINTFSEAAYAAVKNADNDTKDNFIHHYLKDNSIKIDESNRDEFIKKAVRKLSVLNLKTGDGDDVKNLVYEGNVGQLHSDGKFEILKGEGIREASAVNEDQLRVNTNAIKSDQEKLEEIRRSLKNTESTSKTNIPENDFEKNIQSEKIEIPIERSTGSAISGVEEIKQESGLTSKDFNFSQEKTELSNGPENIIKDNASETPALTKNTTEKLFQEFAEAHPDQPNLNEVIKNIPKDFKGNEKLQLDYLKIFSGNDNEKSEGIKRMFDLKYKPEEPVGFTVDKDGILSINDVNGKEGTNVLIDTKNNLIGLDSSDNGKAWGVKSTWFGLGKKLPVEKMSLETLKKVKEFLSEKSGTLQGVEIVDKLENNQGIEIE